jgi:hypothetical protein
MKVRALEVGHSLKVLLPYKVVLIPNQESVIGSAAVAVRWYSHMEAMAMCTIISTPVSGSLPTTDPDHGCAGSRGIVTLTSHQSKS